MMKRSLLVLSVLSTSAPVLAQEPAGLIGRQDASTGPTDVAKEGFEAVVRDPAAEKDTTALTLSAGGTAASGNSRSILATASGDFRWRRNIHQIGALAAANYGSSAVDPESDMETTVNNLQGRVRYDLFFVEKVAAFLAVSARHDTLQGLSLRLNVDPGIAYYFIDEERHQLSGEVGYDFQHDVRTDSAVTRAEEDDIELEKTESRHNARAAVRYENKLNKAVSFNTGLEYLQGLSPAKDDQTDKLNLRLLWSAGLTSSIADSLSIGTTLYVAYDNNPLPSYESTDLVTSVSLVYNLY